MLCLALAVGFAAVAVDVLRWRDTLPVGDVRYRVTPEDPNPWTPSTIAAARAQPVAARRERRRRSPPRPPRAPRRPARRGDPLGSQLALLRNEAQARLEAVASGEDERARRSRAAGLLGVLGLSRLAPETQDPTALLESTVISLKLAIGLDPQNDEAKFNLELALQRARGVQISEAGGGADPSPGGAGPSGAGAGDQGTGY